MSEVNATNHGNMCLENTVYQICHITSKMKKLMNNVEKLVVVAVGPNMNLVPIIVII